MAWLDRGRVVAVAAVLAVVPPVEAAAQSRAGRGVIGVGVSTLRSDGRAAAGIMLDAAWGFAVGEAVGIGPVGDVSVHRYEAFTIASWLGGGRLTVGRERVQVFGQILAGHERCCAVRDFAWQPGGGIDVRITDRLNLRGQVDVRNIRFRSQGTTERVREIRWSAGVSLPF